MTVYKTDLIEKISDDLRYTKVAVRAILNRFLETVVETVHGGETVEILGFGRFYRRELRPRTLPKIGGGTHLVPARTGFRFEASRCCRTIELHDVEGGVS